MDVIDGQTRNHKLQIADEHDNGTELLYVDKMKKLTGNDCMLRKTHEHLFTPMPKLNHIWFENEPNEFKLAEELVGENKIHKTRKTYEIKSNWVENFNELDEYCGVKKLFNEPTNILNFSSSKYLVVFDTNVNSFYLMNNETSQIFKFDSNDIKFIHRSVYEPIYSYTPIKSISLSSKRIKYNLGEKKIDGKKLDIMLFEKFIECNLNIEDTIDALRI